MNQPADLFPNSYPESRQRFRENLKEIQKRWPGSSLSKHVLPGPEDLSIDWIDSPPTGRREKVFILTTAEHGIEGYVGSAMQQRFIDRFLPRLDPSNTGLLLIHAINPWGMLHHRRVNAGNVDLNRNFLWDRQDFNPEVNPGYDQVNGLLNPQGKIRSLAESRLKHLVDLALPLARLGVAGFRLATLMGQYRFPQGLYYGGTDYQEETLVVMGLFRDCLERYQQVLHLDMHTGYGPRYQMSLINSVHEARPSQDFIARFSYPRVVAANPDEFYAIQGDMVDYFYLLWKHEFPGRRFYSAAFEFGTIGEFLDGSIHSPLAGILENQLYWYGARGERLPARVAALYEELFNPPAPDWRTKALADADQAFQGILQAEGYI